ncbi:MAG: UvrD-helicase domain-containing protein [Sedimentibacter sp.]
MAEGIKKIQSDEDLKIYNDSNHFRVFAGPGAGKTHLIIENIKAIVNNSSKMKGSNTKKILCITYTNAAADEIRNRLGSYSKNVFVSTIHSFINEYILSPNQLQLKILIKKNYGILIDKNVKVISQQEGFTTLSGHSKADVYEFIDEKYPEIGRENYDNISRNKMTNLTININPINQVNSTGNEKALFNFERIKVQSNVALAIKDFTWSIAGRLTFDETLFFGLKLLKEYELITHMIRVEFPYIFVDEYQDTNPIQNLILRTVTAKGCIMIAIGDIAQSIYSFQGASYYDFENFRLDSLLSICNCVIEGNRRSTENIIEFLNFIRKGDKILNFQYCAMNKDSNDKVTFIIQKDRTQSLSNLNVVSLDNETYVLCRRWTEAFSYIDDLEDGQRKLLENISNTYTYQLNRDMFTEVEARQEAWIDSSVSIAELEEAIKQKCIPTALIILSKYLDIGELLNGLTKENAIKVNQVISFWENTFSAVNNNALLPTLVAEINEKMRKLEIPILDTFPYPEKGSEEYFEAVYKHIDKLTYKTARKMAKEIFIKDSKYMTIHRAKGKEFKKVIVNGVPFKKESDIFNVNNEILDPQILSNTTDENSTVREEFMRILYVGFSRAINKLYIHLYGDVTLQGAIDDVLKAYYGEKVKDFYDFIIC